MTGVLNRYILVEVLKSTALAALFLVSLVLLITFADELDDMGEGRYGLVEILKYLMLITPRTVYELIPAAALLGALITLGSMANFHELTAMRAAGISRWRIIFSVLQVGFLLMLLSIFISEVIAPSSEQAAQMLKLTAKKEQIALKTKYGFWARDGDTYLNIREINTSSELTDINIYEMTADNKLKYSAYAEEAVFLGGTWHLKNIQQTIIDETGVSVSELAEAEMDTLLDPDILEVVIVKPERLSIAGLIHYISFLQDNGQDAEKYILAITSKIIRPFVILAMLLISIPFVLGSNRVQSTGSRILTGVLIGTGFTLVERLFGGVGVAYGLNPVLSAALPFILVLSVSIVLIRRMD